MCTGWEYLAFLCGWEHSKDSSADPSSSSALNPGTGKAGKPMSKYLQKTIVCVTMMPKSLSAQQLWGWWWWENIVVKPSQQLSLSILVRCSEQL